MTTIPQPNDLTKGYTATWDAWNRLVKLKDGANTVAEFEYDGLNRRTIKKKYAAGSLDETRHFYYSDQWQVLEERTGSSTNADKQFVWGLRYVDDLVLRDKGSERLYALQDANWNVVAMTDDTGTIKQRFAYQPYGESKELNPNFTTYTGTNYNWNCRFTGREIDLNTGLQLNRNRYYHAELGRWINRDPIGYEGGTNLYEYVAGRVLTGSDPLGLWEIKREHESWAEAIPDAGDTARTLANLVQLNVNEYKDWLRPATPSEMPSSADEEVEGCKYKVPNTVFVYETKRSRWDFSLAVDSLSRLNQKLMQGEKSLGVKVRHVVASDPKIFKKGWKEDGIYIFRYVGHGSSAGLAYTNPSDSNDAVGPLEVRPPYKLGAVHMLMCYGGVTTNGNSWRDHVSKTGLFLGPPGAYYLWSGLTCEYPAH